VPDGYDFPAQSVPAHSLITWEDTKDTGRGVFATFGSTVGVRSHIDPNAQGLAVGKNAGYAVNDYHTDFTCYRDDESIVYRPVQGDVYCYRIYYCFS